MKVLTTPMEIGDPAIAHTRIVSVASSATGAKATSTIADSMLTKKANNIKSFLLIRSNVIEDLNSR